MAFGRRRARRNIDARDLADYRTNPEERFDGRSVDIDRASKSLGATKKAVREALSKAKKTFSNTVLRRISGRSDADTSKEASGRGMLQAAYGRGPRGSAINAKAAAKNLGVSPRTVRRWAAGTQQPSADHLKALQAAARRATTTKAGRKAATKDFRASEQGRAALQRGSKVWVDGYQGLHSESDDYSRERRIVTDVNAGDVEAMLRAYEEGGDAGLRHWLTEGPGQNYVDNWEFRTIDDFGFGDPR